ncbi:MAG TPA: hypothetical protein VHO25_04075 [Polyangiaceae bacterium]|nr:hypothetical protein [Polyangiaceae bacterium]
MSYRIRLSVWIVALLASSTLLLACSARNKAPQGPPPEYERVELPPWPPAAAASAQPEASVTVNAGEPVRADDPAQPDEAASGQPNSTTPAPEAIDPPQGSR